MHKQRNWRAIIKISMEREERLGTTWICWRISDRVWGWLGLLAELWKAPQGDKVVKDSRRTFDKWQINFTKFFKHYGLFTKNTGCKPVWRQSYREHSHRPCVGSDMLSGKVHQDWPILTKWPRRFPRSIEIITIQRSSKYMGLEKQVGLQRRRRKSGLSPSDLCW